MPSYESKFRCEFSAFYGIKNGHRIAKWHDREVRQVLPGFGFSFILSYIKMSQKISQKPMYFKKNAFWVDFSCLLGYFHGKYY